MHSNDFSVAFLEGLAADMRALEAAQTAPAPRPSHAVTALTLVSALFTLISYRWM